jgi:choline dehydrogenase
VGELAAMHYDTIIVGAGSTGCVLAARLTERSPSRSVLLLEAGRDFGDLDKYPPALRDSYRMTYSLPGNGNSWPLMAALTDDLTYPITRGRLIGGSSAVNGGAFIRANPDDYDHWAELGNSEWSYEKVLPSLKRLETDRDYGETTIHGGSGPVPVSRASRSSLARPSEAFIGACLDLGHPWDEDMNGPDSQGVGLVPHNTLAAIRYNMATCYLGPAKPRPNLTVLSQAMVRKVIIKRSRAVAVEVATPAATRKIYGDSIVLCAGAIKSPQLLMLSGIGPPSELGRLGIDVAAESSCVGKNLMDHPSVSISYRPTEYVPEAGPRTGIEASCTFNVDGPRSADVLIRPFIYSRMNQLFGVFQAEPFSNKVKAVLGASRVRAARPLWGASAYALRAEVSGRHDLVMLCSLGVEESRGELRLSSADVADSPHIEFRYLSTEVDRSRMRGAVRGALAIMAQRDFQKLKPRMTSAPAPSVARDDASLDQWINRKLGTAYHTTGTCKMGPECDDSAVVDQFGRVRGIDGLRIADISILPTITQRGTNLTAVMLGERFAEFLSAECCWRRAGRTADRESRRGKTGCQ